MILAVYNSDHHTKLDVILFRNKCKVHFLLCFELPDISSEFSDFKCKITRSFHSIAAAPQEAAIKPNIHIFDLIKDRELDYSQ